MLSVISQPDSSINFLNFVLSQCGERLYVASPVVFARQSRIVTSRLAGMMLAVSGGPGRTRVVVVTRGFLNAGIYLEIGSFKLNKPSSQRIRAATPVIGFGVRIQPVNCIFRYRFFRCYVRVSLSFKNGRFYLPAPPASRNLESDCGK